MSQPDVALLEKEVEKKKMLLEKEKVKGVNCSITPAFNHTNTFSPASKPGVCVFTCACVCARVCWVINMFFPP